MSWDFACPDWEQRLRDGRSLVPDLPLDLTMAERAVAVFNKLRLPDVPGQPTFGEAGGPWFLDIVRALFGSLDPKTGERHVRELLNLIPKKNGKTTNGAGLMLTALILNERPRAEFLLIGPTQAIADLAFSQAMGMVEADEQLRTWFQVREHIKEIKDRRTGAKLKIKTFDSKVLTGVKPVGVLIDELHELGKMANAARVIGQLRGGILPNPEGFLTFITTQSDLPPEGVWKAELKKARAIRDGRLNGSSMLPVLYEFPERVVKSGEWRDPSIWHWVTPNNGKSISIPRLESDWNDAQEGGDEEIRRWASQHLDIEIGLALHSERWGGADHWEATADETLTLETLIERCDVITVGVDGGGLDDLLGATAVGREIGTRDWLSISWAWAHPSVLERRKDIVAKLRDLEATGALRFVEEIGQDIEQLVDIIEQIADSGKLDKIGLDPVGIGQIIDALADKKLTQDAEGNDRTIGIPQGWKLSGAIKSTERKLADGTMRHADQALMDWCVGNAKIEPRGNAITITKQTSGSAKIDPLMAFFNAAALMSLNPAAKGRSFWEVDEEAAA